MKIKSEDYAKLKEFIRPVIENHDINNLVDDYRDNGLSPKRLRWDALYASKVRIGDSIGMPGDINLYDYIDDGHIDTALRNIMKELGVDWASSK